MMLEAYIANMFLFSWHLTERASEVKTEGIS